MQTRAARYQLRLGGYAPPDTIFTFRTDCDAGLMLGRQVAEAVWARGAQEPALGD